MSCNIFVDLYDAPRNYYSNNSFNRNNFLGQNIQTKLSILKRALYFRRLKLFKLFMATLVTLLLLFFLFRHSSKATHSQETTDGHGVFEQSTVDHELINKESVHARMDNTPEISNGQSTNLYSILDQPRYSNNLSYSLNSRDFAQMKNINLMQVRIREAMKHSWDNYRKYAWGFDMLKPRAKEPDHWFDLGLTIVDAADSLIMMGLAHDTNLALDWMENELTFTSSNENSNCFELTIRILAGILSAYHLSGREKLKHQAMEMGNTLLHCYDTDSKVVPYSDIDLRNHRAHPPPWNPHSSLSEVASLQLEFRYLSQISGDPKYEQTTFQTSLHLHNLTQHRQQKLLPMYINPSNGQLEESIITLGARSDSYYEYLLKQYLQTGIKWLEEDYLDAIDEIERTLLRHTGGNDNYTYVAEMQIYRTANDTDDIRYYNKMDHLVCFLPGTLALGYYHFSPLAGEYRLKFNLETKPDKLNSRYNNHLDMAKALARTCYHMYSNMGTGLSPEIATFVHAQPDEPLIQDQPELQVQSTSAHNILRPEFVESLFYLYHITGLPMYREQAGKVFEAFHQYARIPSGFSPISDVREKPQADADLNELLHKNAPDRMESFWLSETLKYLYLVYCDDRHIVGTLLNNYVFNTEAHMLPIM